MSDSNDLHRQGLQYKFWYSIVGLILGLACIIVGLVLGLAGVTGHTTWAASLLGFNTNLTDATPGVIVFVVGIFMVYITRFRVKETSTKTSPISNVDPEANRREIKDESPAKPEWRGSGGSPMESVTRSIEYSVRHQHDVSPLISTPHQEPRDRR